MNSDTRAALVAMGQDMARARDVLAATERRSIEYVFRNEFQVTHVRKSDAAKQSPPKKPEDAIHQSNRVGADPLSAPCRASLDFRHALHEPFGETVDERAQVLAGELGLPGRPSINSCRNHRIAPARTTSPPLAAASATVSIVCLMLLSMPSRPSRAATGSVIDFPASARRQECRAFVCCNP